MAVASGLVGPVLAGPIVSPQPHPPKLLRRACALVQGFATVTFSF